MHECNPIEGSPRTHWAESDGNGRTVLDDKRYQHQASINSTLPTLMTTRFLTIWLRLLAEGAISLLHGALSILKSAATI